MLWSVGNPRPVTGLSIDGETLSFTWKRKWRPYGNADDVWILKGDFSGKVVADGRLELRVHQSPAADPTVTKQLVLLGKKMPPMPPRPDLAKVRFGKAIELFNGKDLSGWKLSNPKKKNGWRAEDGVLINETPKTDFSAYGEFGNLVTEAVFEDFRLTSNTTSPKPATPAFTCAACTKRKSSTATARCRARAAPARSSAASFPPKTPAKPGGEWNRLRADFGRSPHLRRAQRQDRDRQPAAGRLHRWWPLRRRHPARSIFLQGDHTSVKYRNIKLEPVATF